MRISDWSSDVCSSDLYYGASLGDASPETKARGNSRPNTSLARNFGFFPTPDEVADGVLSEAYIQNGYRVLEPSAGTGDLARRAAEAGGLLTCIEVQPHLEVGRASCRARESPDC